MMRYILRDGAVQTRLKRKEAVDMVGETRLRSLVKEAKDCYRGGAELFETALQNGKAMIITWG